VNATQKSFLQLGLTLVTNNEREFSRIPNLTIENWIL